MYIHRYFEFLEHKKRAKTIGSAIISKNTIEFEIINQFLGDDWDRDRDQIFNDRIMPDRRRFLSEDDSSRDSFQQVRIRFNHFSS